MNSRINLRALVEGPPEAIAAFLRDTPLSAFSADQEALAAIVPSPAPSADGSAEGTGYELVLGTSLSDERFRLPGTRDYRALRILPGDGLRFEIETAGRTITRANIREMRASMIEWTLRSETEREAAFDALCDRPDPTEAQDTAEPEAITSRVFGTLEADAYSGAFEAGPVKVPYCDGEMLDVAFLDVDTDAIADADDALEAFLTLGPADRAAAAARVLEHCHAFLNAVGEHSDEDVAMLAITDPRDIWHYVGFKTVQIVAAQPASVPAIYVALVCTCAWEQEHGLQLVYRGGTTLTRVSNADGQMT